MSQARLFQVDGPTCVPSSRPEAGAGEGWWSLVSVVVPTDSPMIPIIISEISTVSLFLALPRGSHVLWAEVLCLRRGTMPRPRYHASGGLGRACTRALLNLQQHAIQRVLQHAAHSPVL